MDILFVIGCIAIFVFTVTLISTNRRKVIKKQITKVTSPPENESPVIEDLAETEDPESITQPTTEKAAELNVSKPTVVIVGYIKTSGNDEFYKEKLSKQNWKDKVLEIKRRDGYQCQNCLGLTILDQIDEIKNYVDYPEVGEIVIDIFNNREMYCQPSTKEYRIINTNKAGNFNFTKLINSNDLFNPEIVDIVTISPLNDVKTFGRSNWVDTDTSFRYNLYDSSKRTNSLEVFYFSEGNTNDQLILRNIEWYKSGLPYAKQGVLTFNGFSIVFPLLTIKKESLDVHHLAYYEDFEPWKCPDEELITLCHKCHLKAHEKEIPIKRMTN